MDEEEDSSAEEDEGEEDGEGEEDLHLSSGFLAVLAAMDLGLGGKAGFFVTVDKAHLLNIMKMKKKVNLEEEEEEEGEGKEEDWFGC